MPLLWLVSYDKFGVLNLQNAAEGTSDSISSSTTEPSSILFAELATVDVSLLH